MAEDLPLDRDGPALHRGRAIREIPTTERPRERLTARGAAGLSAAELIGLVTCAQILKVATHVFAGRDGHIAPEEDGRHDPGAHRRVGLDHLRDELLQLKRPL